MELIRTVVCRDAWIVGTIDVESVVELLQNTTALTLTLKTFGSFSARLCRRVGFC